MDDFYQDRWKDPLNGGALISVAAQIGENVTIGANTVIKAGCMIGNKAKFGFNIVVDENCRFGDGVFVGHNSMIRSDVTIGNYSVIGHNVVVEKGTTIGDRVTVQSQTHITGDALIENDVFFGPGVTTSNTRQISHGRKFSPIITGPSMYEPDRITVFRPIPTFPFITTFPSISPRFSASMVAITVSLAASRSQG